MLLFTHTKKEPPAGEVTDGSKTKGVKTQRLVPPPHISVTMRPPIYSRRTTTYFLRYPLESKT